MSRIHHRLTDPDVGTVRVLVADDFELMREGIESALESDPRIEVVGHAADGREAVERAREVDPDVVVLDLRMAPHGGMGAIDLFRDQLPEVKILVFTANQNPANARAATAAGAAGYLTKESQAEELCAAVLSVHQGDSTVAPSLAVEAPLEGSLGPEPGPGSRLTARQRAIVRLVSMGLTDHEIALHLFRSVRTVQYELAEVKRKTGLRRRSEIAGWAVINALG